MNSFDLLRSVLPVPSNPIETGSVEGWSVVHDRIGQALPIDYVRFIEEYGTGTIGNWLSVLNPFASEQHQNLLTGGFALLGTLRELKAEFADEVPFPLFYEPGGLLPWGTSIDGDTFCWLTSGLSGLWRVVIMGHGVEPETHNMTFSEFVVALIRGQLSSGCCPTPLAATFAE